MKIFKQISLITEAVSAVPKDKSGTGINYKFRGVDDLMNALNPLFGKFGVVLSATILNSEVLYFENVKLDREGNEIKTKWTSVFLKMKYSLFADDGSSVSFETIGEGRDNSDKAHNKAMSAALKYFLMHAFLVPTKDIDDSDSENAEIETKGENSIASKQSALNLLKAFSGLGISAKEIFQLIKIESVEQMKEKDLKFLTKIGSEIKKDPRKKTEYFNFPMVFE